MLLNPQFDYIMVVLGIVDYNYTIDKYFEKMLKKFLGNYMSFLG